MESPDGKTKLAARWIERATWRLAECEAEARGLARRGDEKRRQKLLSRSERYRDMLVLLRRRVADGEAKRPDPEKQLDDLEREVAGMKERLIGTAGELVLAREEWQALKTRWGVLADRIMKEREDWGQDPGPVPRLDFELPGPGPGASRTEKAALDLLRGMGI